MDYKLLCFSAPWCVTCETMQPIIDEWMNDNASIVECSVIDIDEDEALANQYDIVSVPTFVLLKEGYEMRRVVGATSKMGFYNALSVEGEINGI